VEYFGIFLILVASAVGWIGPHLTKPDRQPGTATNIRRILFVPSGAAAVLVAVAGFFIFVTSIGSR